jgi:predicted secreted protein
MKARYRLIRLVAGFAVAVTACGEPTPPASPATSPAEQPSSSQPAEASSQVLDESHAGKTIEVTAGTPFSIKLSGNPTTGYEWKVVTVDRSLGWPAQTHTPDSTAVGAGGTTLFTWKTTSPIGSLAGDHPIKIEYRRGGDPKPARELEFTIRIIEKT